VRKYLVFLFLSAVRLIALAFWRRDARWIGTLPPGDPWRGFRVVCLLNHTSLFEWLFISVVPVGFVWRVACHGVVPAAEKTLNRPVVGWFFKFIAAHVVPITRERDHTWREVLTTIDPDSMVLILPEGRMMRRNGLDGEGRPMTVRGGIADILEAIAEGPMLVAYSGGLHHVQAPGESLPRLFRTIRMNLERIDIAAYRAQMRRETGSDAAFKRAVVSDLERRRDLYCPTGENLARSRVPELPTSAAGRGPA
jgi:1-acyl-sn-glycerol-3-phosphate acyltransferase